MRSTTGTTYKIMVWATGGVGRYAIRTAADRPNLELVGAWVHSAPGTHSRELDHPYPVQWAMISGVCSYTVIHTVH